MIKMSVYLVGGNVDTYNVEDQWKAREHAGKIMLEGYRMVVGNRMEWFSTRMVEKVCWDAPVKDLKYNGEVVQREATCK